MVRISAGSEVQVAGQQTENDRSVGSVVCCVELSDVSLRVCSIVDYRFIGQ